MSNKCVMLCEDDEGILNVTKIVLEMSGYRVVAMDNCENIFQRIEEEKPDIILMDLWIPDVGGEVVTKQLKSNVDTMDIPVIIFSANNNTQKIAENIGADGFLCKPFEVSELEAVIESKIRK